jgi:Tfp pilus assembly protein PilF
LFFEQGKLEQAERTYLEALKDLTFEKHARTYYNLALIEIKRNNFSKATKYLQSSLKQSEDYCPSWLEIGKLELKQGKAKDAVKSFHQARMGSCANDPAPLYWQGVALMQAEEYLNARMKFDEFQTKFSNTEYNRLVQQKLTELTLQEAREHSRTKHSQKVLDDTHF